MSFCGFFVSFFVLVFLFCFGGGGGGGGMVAICLSQINIESTAYSLIFHIISYVESTYW